MTVQEIRNSIAKYERKPVESQNLFGNSLLLFKQLTGMFGDLFEELPEKYEEYIEGMYKDNTENS